MYVVKNAKMAGSNKTGSRRRNREERYARRDIPSVEEKDPIDRIAVGPGFESRPTQITETFRYEKPQDRVVIQPAYETKETLYETRKAIRPSKTYRSREEVVTFRVAAPQDKLRSTANEQKLEKRIRELERHEKKEDEKINALESKVENHDNLENLALNGLEHFALNKAYPGLGWSPYVNNSTVAPLPTGTMKIATSITNVLDVDVTSSQPLGTRSYTIIMTCPALSSFVAGTGNTVVSSPFSAGTRLGGYVAIQTDNLAIGLHSALFLDNRYARSSIQMWGSDFSTFGQGGFVWSQAMGMHLVAPAANLTGAYYSGLVTVAQLNGQLTVQQLIQDSSKVSSGTWDTVLKSAVVNPDLVTDINYRINGATTIPQVFIAAENEVVSYVVYQTPAINITTGQSSRFTIIGDLEGNFVYYPNATDPLAFSLGDNLSIRNYNDNMKMRPNIAEHTGKAQKTVVTNPDKYKEVKKQMEHVAPLATKMNLVQEKSGWQKAKEYAQSGLKYGKIPAALLIGLATQNPQAGMYAYQGMSHLEDALSWGEESSSVIRQGSNNMDGARFNQNVVASKAPRCVQKADVLYRIRRIQDVGLPYSFDNIEQDLDSVQTWFLELQEWLQAQPGELIPADLIAPQLDINRFLNEVSGIVPQLKRVK